MFIPLKTVLIGIDPYPYLTNEVVTGGTTVKTGPPGPQSRLEDFDPTGEGHPGMKVRRNWGNATE